MLEILLFILSVIAPFYLRKLKLPPWISVVLLCYATGLAFSTFVGSPQRLGHFVTEASHLCVALAIPAMLLSASWKSITSLGFKGFIALIVVWTGAICAATACTIWGYDPMNIAMCLAIFTGGLANLQAIGLSLNLEESTLIAANVGDLIAGGSFFILLTSIAWPILQYLLPSDKEKAELIIEESRLKTHPKNLALSLLWAAICLGIAFAVSELFPKGVFQIVVLGISALVAISLGSYMWNKPSESSQKEVPQAGQQLGEYLMLVFCVLIGWTADWSQVGQSALLWAKLMGLFICIQVLVSILLAKLSKVSAGLYFFTLVGSIYSPAFVPQMATTSKKYHLVPTGVLIGLIGLASGSFLGFCYLYFMKIQF